MSISLLILDRWHLLRSLFIKCNPESSFCCMCCKWFSISSNAICRCRHVSDASLRVSLTFVYRTKNTYVANTVFMYRQAYPQATTASIWIDSPNGNKTQYYPLDGSIDSSDVIEMNVKNLTGGQCLTANAGPTTGNNVVIKDNDPCITLKPYVCEKCNVFSTLLFSTSNFVHLF